MILFDVLSTLTLESSGLGGEWFFVFVVFVLLFFAVYEDIGVRR